MRDFASALLTFTFVFNGILVAQIPTAPTFDPPVTFESLGALSNADLLKIYESATLAAGATDAMVQYSSGQENDDKCRLIRAEIFRRGGVMAPLFATALKREVTLDRPATHGGLFKPGLIDDEIRLLIGIGDPQAIDTLLDIVQMPGDSKHDLLLMRDPRYQALEAVERLTFVSFHKVSPRLDNFYHAVQHPSALEIDRFSAAEFPKAVQLYRDWLAGEGKDPAQWLPIARKGARALLEGDDLDEAYCGAAFLTSPFSRGAAHPFRDDLPERTLQRITQILNGSKPVPGGKKHDYQYQGKPLPISLDRWLCFLDRWIGQRFDSEEARFAWWEANKDKSSEQWLHDSLPITVELAETGDRGAVGLFRQLFPDAPYGPDESLSTCITIPGSAHLPFRKKWFDEHKAEFVYDPLSGAFRLPKTPVH